MIFDAKSNVLILNDVELRVRPVMLQNKMWNETEQYFKIAEQNFANFFNRINRTKHPKLPISFVYAISVGGYRVRTSTLLEWLGYKGEAFLPSEPDYKFMLKEVVAAHIGIDSKYCFVQTIPLLGVQSLSAINFIILQVRDQYVGLVSMEG